jgi:O-succinylbenzoic acid--CoA ligase
MVDLLDKTHFKFLGRIDNVINSAGLKIFPEKLEQEIEKFIDCPFYVTSVADEVLDQKVVVFIEGEEKLFSRELENLNSYFGNRTDRPRSYFFRQKFNYTHTGKVLKKYFE